MQMRENPLLVAVCYMHLTPNGVSYLFCLNFYCPSNNLHFPTPILHKSPFRSGNTRVEC